MNKLYEKSCSFTCKSSLISLTIYQATKILRLSKKKAFADGIIKILKMMIFVLNGVENIVGKGENAGYQHFLLFPQCFLKAFSLESLKVGIVL